MEILLPSFSYFIVALLILGIYRVFPKFRYFWLLSFISALLVWGYIWLVGINLPRVFTSPIIDIFSPTQSAISFVIDFINWPILLLVSTLMLAVITTDAVRPRENHWLSWSGGFGLVGVGMLSVLSANLFTLLFVWVFVDSIQLVIAYTNANNPQAQKNVIQFFITNIMGVMVGIGAYLFSTTGTEISGLFYSTPQAFPYFVLAVGLRLGVIPLQNWFLETDSHWDKNFLTVKLIPPVSSLVLLIRISQYSSISPLGIIIFISVLITGLYNAIAWIRTENESHSTFYLTFALSSMVIISSLYGELSSALSWSLVLISVGGFWVVYSARNQKYQVLLIGNIIILLAIPFSPNFAGNLVLTRVGIPFSILISLIPVLLAHGLVRKFQWKSILVVDSIKWIPGLYFIGLLFLPVTHLFLLLNSSERFLFQKGNYYWVLSVLLFGFFMWQSNKKNYILENIFSATERIFSQNRTFNILAFIFQTIKNVLNFINKILESRTGIIWSLIIFSIFISILSDISGGITP